MSSEYMMLPGLLLCTLLCIGLWLVFIKERPEDSLQASLAADSQVDALLRDSGFGISAAAYYRGLLSVCGLICFYALLKAVLSLNLGIFLLGMAASLYLYFIFRPVLFLFGNVKSLFSILLGFLAASKRKRMDRGLYSSCVVLKNLAIVWQSAPLSGDKMLEKLAGCAVPVLRPVYHTMLSMYRTGKSKEAFTYFGNAIGTPTGRVFAGLLSKLDQINPAELREQADALIDAISEKRVTEGFVQAQTNGAITMTLATITITIAMLDFLVVVVYMDLIQMLSTLW